MPLTQLRRVGLELSRSLAYLAPQRPVIVAVPRRGVVVAREISQALNAELDVVLAAKVFIDRETAGPIGAVALGGVHVIDELAAAAQGLRLAEVEAAVAATERRLGERLPLIRGNLAMPELRDRLVVLVDDAAITGLTMQVAIGAVSQRSPARIVVALGLCSRVAGARLAARAAEVYAVEWEQHAEAARRHDAAAIALCPPLSDEEVHTMLRCGWARRPLSDGGLELDGISAHER